MDLSTKSIQNNDLAAFAARAPEHVLASIKKASAHTGVNFAYLLQQAQVESSFNPKAKAKTSSAAGLYQFIESTWLSMVKKYGDKHGMGDLAAHIGNNGKVDSRSIRKEILALRNDPEKASALAAEFANENKKFLQTNWGGKVGSTELYLAHFMGAGGAAAFLRARDDNPLQQAAVIFPDAAKSNRNVFYDTKTGRMKTLDEVYAFFDKKFDIETDEQPGAPAQMAAVEVSDNQQISSSVFINAMNDKANGQKPGGFFHSYTPPSYNSLVASPVELMLLGQMDMDTNPKIKSTRDYNG